VNSLTKEEIKETVTVHEILSKYGYKPNRRGFYNCPFHLEKTASAKIKGKYLHCFGCGGTWDVFDITMELDQCDFHTAFELLGGTEKPSFTATVKANKRRREREQRIEEEHNDKAELRQIRDSITAYRNIIAEAEPLSDLWTYCKNKLQYQLYLLDLHIEKR
jgi:DNA primase